jgi:hypothetical protein
VLCLVKVLIKIKKAEKGRNSISAEYLYKLTNDSLVNQTLITMCIQVASARSGLKTFLPSGFALSPL